MRFVPAGALGKAGGAGEKAPWGRSADLERGDFFFGDYGVRLDGSCVLRVPLPPWQVGRAHLRRIDAAGAVRWRVAFRLDVARLGDELRSLRAEAPAAQGEFDLYLRDGVLRYLRRPCAPADVRRRFFLHVVPETDWTLPRATRRHGFDNLDFEFGEHGALLDGACVAMLTLPDYDIAHMSTGQIDAAGAEAWRVELAGDAAHAGR